MKPAPYNVPKTKSYSERLQIEQKKLEARREADQEKYALAKALLDDEKYHPLLEFLEGCTTIHPSNLSSDPLIGGSPEQTMAYKLGQGSWLRILREMANRTGD